MASRASQVTTSSRTRSTSCHGPALPQPELVFVVASKPVDALDAIPPDTLFKADRAEAPALAGVQPFDDVAGGADLGTGFVVEVDDDPDQSQPYGPAVGDAAGNLEG